MPHSTETISVRKLTLGTNEPPGSKWWGGRAFQTHWFNALSQGLPRAEVYAISCVKASLPHLEDPELQALARGFIGQEASHSFLHNVCNVALDKQGLSFLLEGYTRWRLSKAHGLHRLSGLALTVSCEHFTSILCDHTLRHTDLPTNSDEPFRALWMWHCAEELEHQSLTHDVYTASGGGYWRKVLWDLYGTGLFLGDFVTQTLYNLYRDRCLLSLSTWSGAARYLFGSEGLVWFALPRWFAFFKPSFHPSLYNDNTLISQTLHALSAQLRVVSTAGKK